MPRRKRHTKKKPDTAAPAPIAKTIKKRRRRSTPVAQPVPVTTEPKTVMERIFEGQRAELDRLNEEIQKRVFE
jgi:hypothetical protein